MQIIESPEPAGIKCISDWEEFFHVAMPHDLKKLLMQSNGPTMHEPIRKKELQFLSTSDAIEYYKAYKFREFCADAIPICLDGSANFVVYKRQNDEVGSVYAMAANNLGWEDSPMLKENITDVISMEKRVEKILLNLQ